MAASQQAYGHLKAIFTQPYAQEGMALLQWTPGKDFKMFLKRGKWINLEIKILNNELVIRFPEELFDRRTSTSPAPPKIAKQPTRRANGVDYATLQEAVTLVNNAIDNGARIKQRTGKLVVVAEVELS